MAIMDMCPASRPRRAAIGKLTFSYRLRPSPPASEPQMGADTRNRKAQFVFWPCSARRHDLGQVELGLVQHSVHAGRVHQLDLPLEVRVLLVPSPHVERFSVLQKRPETHPPTRLRRIAGAAVVVVVVLTAAALQVAAESTFDIPLELAVQLHEVDLTCQRNIPL